MSYWKTGRRIVDGKLRKVRKLYQKNPETGKHRIVAVRLFGRPHYTDKTAAKRGIRHERGFVNNPNSAKRVNHYRY